MSLLQGPGLKERLVEGAKGLGFALVGFTDVAPFTEAQAPLEQWLAAGGRSLFPYMDLDRLDPRAPMAEARSAMVGFFPYARPEAVPGRTPGSLRLSRYLWGKDYHMTLKGRLNRLLDAVKAEFPGLEGRVCVDTAPVLERQLAVRAGLGWQGRHTLLIAGKGGSWGLLGVLLLNQALAVDPPFQGHRCGSCRACLEACPTGALSPWRLDPTLCLTTYTLETEAEPPPSVIEAMRATGWVAGCDRCQEVCPWNRTPIWGDPALWGGANLLHAVPAEALPRGTAQWKKASRQTALRRVRHRHWLANLDRVQNKS